MEENDSGAVVLTPFEKRNLESFRAYHDWCTQNLPSHMFSARSDRAKHILIQSLLNFEYTRGASTFLFEEGAVLLAADDDALLHSQLEGLLNCNLKLLSIATPPEKLKIGKHKNRVRFARAAFEKGLHRFPLGLKDEERIERLWSEVYAEDSNFQREDFDAVVGRLNTPVALEMAPARLGGNIALLMRAKRDINVKVEALTRPREANDVFTIALAFSGAPKTGFYLNLLKAAYRYGYALRELVPLYIPESAEDSSLMIHLKLQKRTGVRQPASIEKLLEELSTVQWIEFENPLNQNYLEDLGFSIHHSLLLRSVEEFLMQMLAETDPGAFTPDRIHSDFVHHPEICRALVEYFSQRFNPVRHGESKAEKARKLLSKRIEDIDSGIAFNDERRRKLFRLALCFVARILKTNYYVIRRSALSFRMDPEILNDVQGEGGVKYPELPHGIFYIKGKNFIAFNIRFRELARGGVRTLFTIDPEKLSFQQMGIFRECYHLAYTQQRKNKDIPEGGSKSIIFIKPSVAMSRELGIEEQRLRQRGSSHSALVEAMKERRATLIRRQLFDAQQSFADVLLDLLVWNDKTGKLASPAVVDLLGKEELVFLGPDENMTNDMIDWISNRSHDRSYRVGRAFMSGKKELGINHKQYGVTSLGVHAYMGEALKSLGIHPEKDSFTVKMSGGPDGDVAGNQLINLINDYGDRAIILAIVDGTGCVYDPKGLSQKELMRLFEAQAGVSAFRPDCLNPGAEQLLIHERRSPKPGLTEVRRLVCGSKGTRAKEEWIGASEANRRYGQVMNTIQADVFLPCGGRPRTLHAKNWEKFLDETGQPTAKLIVEGANLYLDEEARVKLESKGVLVIKDSSANKCGVICSSFEILSGLLLTPEEFAEVKPRLIPEILKILRTRALEEAKLLMMEREDGRSVVKASDTVSERINHFTDLLFSEMERLMDSRGLKKKLEQVELDYLPPLMRELASDRVKSLPLLYRKSLLSCFLASQLIYQRGLGFEPSLLDTLAVELDRGLIQTVKT